MSFEFRAAHRPFSPITAKPVVGSVLVKPGTAEQNPEPHVFRGPGLPGALARGMAIAGLVLLPALVIPGIPPETAHLVVLLALFAAALTAYEYASPYPGLLEFRFGAPYNRTRFLLIGIAAALLALLQRHETDPGALSGVVATLAAICGDLLAGAPSPVALLAQALPDSVSDAQRDLVRDGAALILMFSICVIALFGSAMHLGCWPHGGRPFNVWINLPTFEPTAGRDVVARLRRQSSFSLILGCALPFLTPGLILASTILMQPVSLTSPLGFVWGIVLWAYVSSALIMRGMAMARIAQMIEERRTRIGIALSDTDA
ncbi:hypothetical protein [Pararhodobacter sp. SW119]|uniref:hypothetical protein n=1 Tax=Pararhodobacter sp. SW119 TaxID=2780075 RepID=UPI001ADFF6E3|nr:hypothetical protein [Pararhodobacter sp. SW119]